MIRRMPGGLCGLATGLLVLTAVAVWLRLDGIGSRGFWRDEAQCIFISQKSFPAGIVEALRAEAHPPLYYALQHFWIHAVGWSEFRIRALSVVFGGLVVPALFFAGCRLFDPLAGTMAAVVGACAPLHVVVSGTARMYSLLSLLALLSVWCLYEAWRGKHLWWIGYVFATAGVVYTHNWGLFLVAAQNVWAAWAILRHGGGPRRWAWWVSIQAILAVLYLPWFQVVLRQLEIISVLPFVPVPSPAERLWQLAEALLARWPAIILWIAVLALGICPQAFLGKLLPLGRDQKRGSDLIGSVASAKSETTNSLALGLALACSLGTLGLGVLVSLRTYGQVPAYVTLVVFPALCLLLGKGLSRFRPVWVNGVLVVPMLWFSFQELPRWRFAFKSTLREVAFYVQERAGPEDMIVIAPDYLATTFNTYFRGGQPQIAFPWTMGRLEAIDCTDWNARWLRAAEAVPATLERIRWHLSPAGKLWLIVASDEFPEERHYYEQVRRLKKELDAHYALVDSATRFRNGTEWADVFVYQLQ